MSRTGIAVEKRKFSKIPNWRHYLLKTRVNERRIDRIVESDSTGHFGTPQGHRNNSEAR